MDRLTVANRVGSVREVSRAEDRVEAGWVGAIWQAQAAHVGRDAVGVLQTTA